MNLWSILHCVTNNLSYLVSFNKISQLPATDYPWSDLPLQSRMPFNFLCKQLRPDLFHCQDEWGSKQQSAHGGEYHRLHVTRRLDSCSLQRSSAGMMEMCWPRGAKTTSSVWTYFSEAVINLIVHVFQFSVTSISSEML